ncbi:hypothetical protein AOQ84DRAFT_1345 [Glonium stellatum]|uniref:Uncharacterized protein n=1 Tax=Glonium stellatum TaxID=574774 RepID=A0A8E2F4Q8_9PEZI|nr:hypothetical protein AOQ84DRAFT_1345 [Glonium stellatum]
MSFDASILLPLYIYPSAGAWDPLYQAASGYPNLDFTVIVNPNSGPGDSALPDANYTQGIATLSSYNNVRTIGYVATSWAQKDVNTVLQEIATYAAWSDQNSSLALGGIFFDETPAQYDPDSAQYLQTISDAVRSASGLADGYVVHNPGSVPDARYLANPLYITMADATVVFEDTYESWTVREPSLAVSSLPYDHNKLACLLHSVPEMTQSGLSSLLTQVVGVGEHVYLTGTVNYTSFGGEFQTVVGILNGLVND